MTDNLAMDLQSGIYAHRMPRSLFAARSFYVHGIGMRIDLEAQQLEIIEYVETIYYPP